MLIERNLAVAATALGFVLAGPSAVAVLQGNSHGGGVGLLVGGIVGAVGVYFGAAVAGTCSDQRARAARIFAWTVAAIMLSLMVSLGAVGHGSAGWRAVFVVAALLPPVSVAVACCRSRA